ncbi:SMP-30/gluconolactonase/LRE family protein [Phenylobacterium sp. LjRoot219]|uniref:SMP-30/gluconolactonase/LRE family protein n=1 Tax=Phenylobacterium sp. LjRoot219 TaxID=3342283 RepID=UPI003ECE5684
MSETTAITRLPIPLVFPEGPRWHDGALWFSEITERTINRLTPAGDREVVLRLEDSPSGLGFMPDGSLLFVSMTRRQLLRWDGGSPRLHADLSGVAGEYLNDMVVDADGRAYVGVRSQKVSPAVFHREPGGPDCVVVVEPDGRASVAAHQLCAPNGTVISADGHTVVLAETYARRLTVFDRAWSGEWLRRRRLIQFERTFPDGVCIDAENAVWVCSPYSSEVVRVSQAGEVTDRLAITGAVACALGGDHRRTLFVLAVDPRWLPTFDPALGGPLPTDPGPAGAIYALDVAVPGAGWP